MISPARDERRVVQFRFEGREVEAREGQSVAAALVANGVEVLARSFKYHRPRGYTCGAGACPNCLMRIDSVPGVPSCRTPVSEGLEVARERGWPSVDVDMLAAASMVARWFPAGFQFRYFRRHQRISEAVHKRLAVLAGGSKQLAPEGMQAAVRTLALDCSVLVVGGGPAGLTAALAASRDGADVVLVEEQARLGGRIHADTAELRALSIQAPGPLLATALIDLVTADKRITVVHGAALGWYEDEVLPVAGRDVLYEIRPHVVVEATGSLETPVVFAGNDRPGVMMAGGLQWLLHVDRVVPGRRVAVLAQDDRGVDHALELHAVGLTVAAVIDARESGSVSGSRLVALERAGIRLHTDAKPVQAHGRRRVRALSVQTPDGRVRVRCDTVSAAGPLRATEGVSLQMRYVGANRLRALGLDADPLPHAPQCISAGGSAGCVTVQQSLDDGTRAGRTAAAAAAALTVRIDPLLNPPKESA